MKRKYDVVIVGAGPAGLRCAEILAKNNKRVLVLEKNKIIGSKVCAGGVTSEIINSIVTNKIIQRKFKKVTFKTPFQNTELGNGKYWIATIYRKDLGKYMAKNSMKAGSEIRMNSEVKKINNNFLIVNNSEKVYFDYLIGADGSNSIVRKSLGIKTNNFLQAYQYITSKKFKDMEIIIDPEKFGPCYLWIFPYKNKTSVGTGVNLAKNIKKPILGVSNERVRENFDNFCKKRFDIKKAKFEAAIINYDYQGHEFGNKFLIGDAGGFASGLTGEGICFAIHSAEDVANKILNKKYKQNKIKHILEVKKREELLLRTFEINRFWTEAEWEILNFILKSKFIDKGIIDGGLLE